MHPRRAAAQAIGKQVPHRTGRSDPRKTLAIRTSRSAS
jgi:hypothetical protein